MKKKLLSTLMAMIMVLSMFPAAALEESVDPQSSGTTATEASGQEPDTTEDEWTEVSDAEALGAALTSGGNIRLTASIEVSEKQNWTVDGKKVVLDLNNCTISSSYGAINNFIMTVKNGGSLTVTDNSAEKGGKIEATDSSYGYGIQLYSESSFTLQAGTIETTQETVDIYDSTPNCIVDIAGGKLISTTDNVLGVRGNGTKVTITGGELGFAEDVYNNETYYYAVFDGAWWQPDATLTMNQVDMPSDLMGSFSWCDVPDHLVLNGCKVGYDAFSYANNLPTTLEMTDCEVGSQAFSLLTDEALETARNSDAVLLGAVGGNVGNSRWYDVAPNLRPEAGLLKIRKGLGLFANIRPAKLFSQLKDACPLKPEIIGDGFDIVMMRELTGGVYFGEHKTEEIDGIRKSTDIMAYDENEIKRIAVKAFEVARKRGRNVTSVDKANVLDTSRLWRAVVDEVAKDYPDVTVKHMLVDNCAMQLVMNPRQFDVILTENMFGDILSDEASMITGSIGMLSSASLGAGKLGLYEPSHGSAPDIAGKGIANPIATILSAAMLLRYSFDLDEEAKAVETAVEEVLKAGYRTIDIMSEGMTQVGTVSMGDLIAEKILG